MSGSDHEPAAPAPEQAAELMRDATERLRDRAWMITALTGPDPVADPASRPSTEVDTRT